MAPLNARQKGLLILLGLMAVVLVIWYRKALFPAKTEESGTQEIKTEEVVRPWKDLPDLVLDHGSQREGFKEQRNLFDFGPSPDQMRAEQERLAAQARAAEAAKRQAEVQRKIAEERIKNPPPPTPPPPPPRPVPPSFPYTFIGRLGPIKESLAVLKGTGQARVMTVRAGETIDNKFVIKKVDYDELIIGYTDSNFAANTETVKMTASGKR